MANLQFNVSKGRANELVRRIRSNDPANSGLIIHLFQTTVADSVMEDYATTAEIVAANTEATFTGYAAKVLADTDLADPVVDNSGNVQSFSIPSVAYGASGGATNNTLARGTVSFCPDITSVVLANCIPLTAHDLSVTTDGSPLNLNGGVILTSS